MRATRNNKREHIQDTAYIWRDVWENIKAETEQTSKTINIIMKTQPPTDTDNIDDVKKTNLNLLCHIQLENLNMTNLTEWMLALQDAWIMDEDGWENDQKKPSKHMEEETMERFIAAVPTAVRI